MSQFISEEIRGIDVPFENAVAAASTALKVDLAKMSPIDRLNYLVKRITEAESAEAAASASLMTKASTSKTIIK